MFLRMSHNRIPKEAILLDGLPKAKESKTNLKPTVEKEIKVIVLTWGETEIAFILSLFIP